MEPDNEDEQKSAENLRFGEFVLSLQKSTIVSSVVAIACVVVMLILTVVNVSGLTESVKARTNSYLRDVSDQSAQVIEERFAGLVNSLEIIGNSLAFSVVVSDEEFLSRKLVLTEFDALAYIRMDGTGVMVDTQGNVTKSSTVLEDYADSDAFGRTLHNVTSAGFYDDFVAFMVPITADERDPQDDDVKGVMIGVRSTESLEDLLVNNAFGGSGFTFIIDQYDEILTRPMEDEEHEMLTELVHETLSEAASKEGVSGGLGAVASTSREFTIETPNGTTLLLDYQPLHMFDWAVGTAVDENFLAEVVNNYVMRIIVTVTILMAVVTIVLVLMIIMQRRYQKRLEAVAFVDSLTGGMSFIRFRMLAEPLIRRGADDAFALVTLNVKRFKLINRLGGSLEGDNLLRRIYKVLQDNLQNPDEMVAHSTADNFALLLRNEGEEQLIKRLEKIAQEVEALDTVLPVRVSQGVYVTSDPEVDIIMFLDRSNIARISETHEYHSTIVFYDDSFVKQQEERLRMIGMIEEGLQKEEFIVYLQPKVSPQTNMIGGAEALVRWIHPTRGMIGPNLFIPLCEQNGLICALDLYVFRKVCEQIEEWHKKGWEPHTISVNVSGMHLSDLEFVKEYRQIVDEHNVDPGRIELELTESIMFSDLEAIEARSVIDTIHEYGFKCSMDDFGSGYSALGLLSDLPIDCIKLDRSFFVDCIGNYRAQTVIASIIHLAQDLDITTVAEGIEDKEQVEVLRDLGCDLIQGFYYSRPLPMPEFAKLAFVEHKVFE